MASGQLTRNNFRDEPYYVTVIEIVAGVLAWADNGSTASGVVSSTDSLSGAPYSYLRRTPTTRPLI